MGAAALAIAPIGQRLSAACVGNRIPHARAHCRRIHQGWSLENRDQNQGKGEETTVHGGESVPQRQRLTM